MSSAVGGSQPASQQERHRGNEEFRPPLVRQSGMIPTAPAGGIAYNVRRRCRPCSFFMGSLVWSGE
jgi:hypothetical protein